MDMHRNEQPVCGSCGSARIRVDAWAEWNLATKAWALQRSHESDVWCNDCHRATFLEWWPSRTAESARVLGSALGETVPKSRAEAVNLIFKAAKPFEGQRYARLEDADRLGILKVWSRCASFLGKPARPIVKHGIVDLSSYRTGSTEAA